MLFAFFYVALLPIFSPFAKEIYVTFNREKCGPTQNQCDGSSENPYSSLAFAIRFGCQLAQATNENKISILIEAGPHFIFQGEAELANYLSGFTGSVNISVYEGPFNPLELKDPSLKGKAFVSLRTQSFILAIQSSLILKNVIFEGRNSHMEDHQECVYSFAGCCENRTDLIQIKNRCYINEKFTKYRAKISESDFTSLIYFQGPNIIVEMENVSFIGFVGVKYSALIGIHSEVKGIQGVFKFFYFEENYLANGLVYFARKPTTESPGGFVVLEFAGVLIVRYNPYILNDYKLNIRQKSFIFGFRGLVSENINFRGLQIKESEFVDYIFVLENVSRVQVFDASFSNFVVFGLTNSNFSLNNTAFSTGNINSAKITEPDLKQKFQEMILQNFELSNAFNNSEISCSFCYLIFDKDPMVKEVTLFKVYQQNKISFSYSFMLLKSMPFSLIILKGDQNTIDFIGTMIVYPGNLIKMKDSMQTTIKLIYSTIQGYQQEDQTLFISENPSQYLTLLFKNSKIDGMFNSQVIQMEAIDSYLIFEDSALRNLYYASSSFMILYPNIVRNTLVLRRTEIFNINAYVITNLLFINDASGITINIDFCIFDMNYSPSNAIFLFRDEVVYITNSIFRNYSGASWSFIHTFGALTLVMSNSSIIDSRPLIGNDRNFQVGPFVKFFRFSVVSFENISYANMNSFSGGSLIYSQNGAISLKKVNIINIAGELSLIKLAGNSNLTINGLTFTGSSNKIFIESLKNMNNIYLEKSLFSNFSISAIWGVITSNTKATILNTRFQDFQTDADVSIMLIKNNNDNVAVINCSFFNIRSSGFSGILSLAEAKSLVFKNSNFENIFASYGSIVFGTDSMITFQSCFITNSSSVYRGGAFDIQRSFININESQFKNVYSTTFGCGFLKNSILNVSNTTFAKLYSLKSDPVLYVSGAFEGRNINILSCGTDLVSSYFLSVEGMAKFLLERMYVISNNFKYLIFLRNLKSLTLNIFEVSYSKGGIIDGAGVESNCLIKNGHINSNINHENFAINLESALQATFNNMSFLQNSLTQTKIVYDTTYGLLRTKNIKYTSFERLNFFQNFKDSSSTLIYVESLTSGNFSDISSQALDLICVRAIKIMKAISLTFKNISIVKTSHPQLFYLESIESVNFSQIVLTENDFRSFSDGIIINSLVYFLNVKDVSIEQLYIEGVPYDLIFDRENMKSFFNVGAAIYFDSILAYGFKISLSSAKNIKGKVIHSQVVSSLGEFSAKNLVFSSLPSADFEPMQGISIVNFKIVSLKNLLLDSLGSPESKSSVWILAVETNPSKVTVEDCTFNQCESTSGGALSLHGNIQALVTKSLFTHNKARRKRLISVNDEVNGVAGAVFYNCSYDTGCKLNLTRNSFESNFAENFAGNVFCFNNTYSVTSEDNFFFNNSDNKGYSPIIGSFSKTAKVIAVLEDGTDKHLVESENNTISDLKDTVIINNGKKININIGFFDAFNTMTYFDDASKVVLRLNESVEFFSDNEANTLSGSANFNKLLIKGERGKGYSLRVEKIGLGSFINNQELSTKFFIRNCLIGEIDIKDQSLCEICTDNTYSVWQVLDKCEPCPKNADCSGGSIILPKLNYWRGSFVSNLIIKCPVKGTCLSIETEKFVFPNMCYPGHKGALCTVCEAGYSKNSLMGPCMECAKIDFVNLIMIIFKILFFIVFTVTAVSKQKGKGKGSASALPEELQQESIFIIFLDHLNQIFLLFSIQGVSEQGLDNILSALNIGSNIIADQTINFECLLYNSNKLSSSYPGSFVKFLISFIMPIFQIVVVVLVLVLRELVYLILYLAKKRLLPPDISLFVKDIMPCILVILMNLYTTLVWNFFKILNCQQLYSDDPKTYLYLDTSVECWSSSHVNFLLSFGLPYAILWVLGVPLFVLIVFIINKKAILHFLKKIRIAKDTTQNQPNRRRSSLPVFQQLAAILSPESLYFLFFGFKNTRYFWVLVVLFWKLSISFFVNFLSGDSLIFTLIGFYILIIAIYNIYKPYLFEAISNFQISLFILNLWLVISIGIMTSDQSEKIVGQYFFYIALAANILFNLFGIPYYLREALKFKSKRLVSKLYSFKKSVTSQGKRSSGGSRSPTRKLGTQLSRNNSRKFQVKKKDIISEAGAKDEEA